MGVYAEMDSSALVWVFVCLLDKGSFPHIFHVNAEVAGHFLLMHV